MVKKVKKVSDTAPALPSVAYSPSMYVDFEGIKEITDVKIGDKVRILVEGTIVRISQEKRTGEKATSSICLEKFKAELVEDNNELDGLADED